MLPRRHLSALRIHWLILAMVLAMLAPSGMLSAQDFCDSGYKISGNLTLESARELCKNLSMTQLEGVWEYPDDEVSVIILRDKWKKGAYNVYIVEAVDCRLYPGMKIGEASDSADPLQFKMALCSKVKRGIPGSRVTCLAKLTKSGEALIIQAPKVKISLTPSIMLPALWNKLRLSLRTNTSNPIEKLPEGWRKVYPSYDGNGSSSSTPRYL